MGTLLLRVIAGRQRIFELCNCSEATQARIHPSPSNMCVCRGIQQVHVHIGVALVEHHQSQGRLLFKVQGVIPLRAGLILRGTAPGIGINQAVR